MKIKTLFFSTFGLILANSSFATTINTNDWIKILIGEHTPFLYGTDQAASQAYADTIKKFAPQLEQIHLRAHAVMPPGTPAMTHDEFLSYITSAEQRGTQISWVDQYALLMNALAANYLVGSGDGPSLQIAFHPDNSHSKAMYTSWGCNNNDWQCVLDHSITFMNAVNAATSKNYPTAQFKIFSIEQSYIETNPGIVTASLADIKACFNNTGSGTCPAGITKANPQVDYGIVGGGREGDSILGINGYDYSYPQGYNLEVKYQPALSPAPAPPKFPAATLPNGQPPESGTYYVVDNDPSCIYYCKNEEKPYLPNQLTGLCQALKKEQKTCDKYPEPAKFSVYVDSSQTPNVATPSLAANYVAWLLSHKDLTANAANGQAHVTWLFSGEVDDFMGNSAWTLTDMANFHSELTSYLKQYIANLPANAGIEVDQLKFGIWNYSSILSNNFPKPKPTDIKPTSKPKSDPFLNTSKLKKTWQHLEHLGHQLFNHMLPNRQA